MNNTIWSDYVQTTQELYLSRALRFREDNKDLWLRAIGLHDGMRVLEVGCGSGIFCHRIKTFLPGCMVTGVDLDSGHIAWAKNKTAQLGLDCTFVQGDALMLPFEDGSFDLCFSHTVIEHIEPKGFLREQYRVLAPGGVLNILSVRERHGLRDDNGLLTVEKERPLFEKAWTRADAFEKTQHVGAYPLKESDFPRLLEDLGLHNVSLDFLSDRDYCPDSADVPWERAVAQIESARCGALASIEKARRIAPDNLTKEEHETLISWIQERYDRRLQDYLTGKKHWDYSFGVTLAARGLK